MLDLQSIKDRLEMASPDKGRRVGYPPDADLQNNAYDDLTALVDEVERLRIAVDMYRRITGDNEAEIKKLRGAIEAHRTQCHKTYKVAQAWWDEELWAVLDA